MGRKPNSLIGYSTEQATKLVWYSGLCSQTVWLATWKYSLRDASLRTQWACQADNQEALQLSSVQKSGSGALAWAGAHPLSDLISNSIMTYALDDLR
jgi:hypothetical protein